MAWGRVSAQGWKPKILAERACGHRNPGSLSRVMVLAGSYEPKTKAFQLSVILRTASA